MAEVTCELVGRERRQTLTNLFQLYAHDFSEHWFDRAEGEIDEDGRLEEYGLMDSYWSEPNREVMLIRVGGRIAGFAMVNNSSHSGLPLDFAVAEFFVARKHRRSGVGFAAAAWIIRERPGLWELAVARRNTSALSFWREVASSIAGPSLEEIERDNDLWNGWIIRFRA